MLGFIVAYIQIYICISFFCLCKIEDGMKREKKIILGHRPRKGYKKCILKQKRGLGGKCCVNLRRINGYHWDYNLSAKIFHFFVFDDAVGKGE